MQIATRLPKAGTTIFSVMSELAARHGAINLGQGFPDFDPPEALREAVSRAMVAGHNQYAPAPGILSLREALAANALEVHGRTVDPHTDVTITSGATEALFAAIAAVVHPGDEAILLDPCYDSYDPAVTLAGGVPVHVPLDGTTFRPDFERIRAAITPRTRLLLVNSPHNPTGAVLTPEDLDALEALVEGTGIVVLSDEVYEHMVFDGGEHQSVLRRPALAERSFVVGSFGKTWHCTGWKVGYCIAPPALSAEFRKIHQYLTFCTFTPAQHGLAEVLGSDPGHWRQLPAFYQARRDRFRDLLAPGRLRLLPVAGAYFQVVDYSAIDDRPDMEFCRWLVEEAGVAAIPLSAFQEHTPADQRLVRLCFAKSDATLEAAAERLVTL